MLLLSLLALHLHTMYNNIVLFIFSLNSSIPGRIAFLSGSSYRLYADREGCTAPGRAFSLSYGVYYIYMCNPKIRGIRSASVLRRSRFTDEGFFFSPDKRKAYNVRRPKSVTFYVYNWCSNLLSAGGLTRDRRVFLSILQNAVCSKSFFVDDEKILSFHCNV